MRLLHLVHQYLPDYVGGTELYTKWIAEIQHQQGHKVSVFYRRSGTEAQLDQRDDTGLQVWRAQAGTLNPSTRFLASFYDLTLIQFFEQVLEETNPNLVHIQHLMGHPFGLVKAIQKRGVPYLVTLHDFWWVCANAQLVTNYDHTICDGPNYYINCSKCALARAGQQNLWPAMPSLMMTIAYRNRQLRRILAQAERIIAPTQFVADWYIAHGIKANKITTLPHGLPLPDDLKRQPRQTAQPIRFAYIGGLSWQKGVHVLLQAFQEMPTQAELWIAGDESVNPGYAEHLQGLSTEQVHFLGRLSRRRVWQTLAEVDVIVVPTLWYETFSFIISEAFAAGVPVIASNLGPLSSRIQDGVDGLLIPHDDAEILRQTMCRFIDDPTLLSTLQKNITIPQSIEDYATQLDTIYQQAINGK